MMGKAARQYLIRGLMPDAFPAGIVSLQYTNDTLLFLDNDMEKAKKI
jgi:hypothetical protein